MLLLNTEGVALTVELMVEEAYCAIVIPMAAAEGSVANFVRMSENLVNAFVATLQAPLLDCLSSHSRLLGVRAEPMVNGNVPFSIQHPLGTGAVGTFVGDDDPEPSTIGGVIDFYFDPSDVAGHPRTVVSHNTIPGIDQAATDGNYLKSAVISALRVFGEALIDGTATYDDTGSGGDNLTWRRVNKILRGAANQSVRAAVAVVVKDLVGSVAKRLYPPRR
jgi:hypothetical protein